MTHSYIDVAGNLLSVGDKVSVRDPYIDINHPACQPRFGVIEKLVTMMPYVLQYASVDYIADGISPTWQRVSMNYVTKLTDEEYDNGIVLQKLTKVY